MIPVSYDIINSGSGPQRKHIQTSYTHSKLNCHGVGLAGRQDRPKQKASLKMNTFTARTVYPALQTVFSFDFPCTRISLKFDCWDWDLAKT